MTKYVTQSSPKPASCACLDCTGGGSLFRGQPHGRGANVLRETNIARGKSIDLYRVCPKEKPHTIYGVQLWPHKLGTDSHIHSLCTNYTHTPCGGLWDCICAESP